MKTKGKKAAPKKAIPSTKVEAPVVAASAILASPKVQVPAVDVRPMEALIEALPEKPKLVAATVETRRVITSEHRQQLISQAAYYRAQRAGFGQTNPIEDWLLAEREIDAMIAVGAPL